MDAGWISPDFSAARFSLFFKLGQTYIGMFSALTLTPTLQPVTEKKGWKSRNDTTIPDMLPVVMRYAKVLKSGCKLWSQKREKEERILAHSPRNVTMALLWTRGWEKERKNAMK